MLRSAGGHYPRRIASVKHSSVKALLVAAPLVLGGSGTAWWAHRRAAALSQELAEVDARGRAEGASYLRTLQGSHAELHLDLLTRRHDVAVRLAQARRDRWLGGLAALGGVLAYAFVRAAQRIAGEVEEAREPRPPGPGGPRDARPPGEPASP